MFQNKRKLKFTLEAIQSNGAMVGVNTHRANRIVEEAINKENIRKKFGIAAEEKFVKMFLGEKVFRKFMNTIRSQS